MAGKWAGRPVVESVKVWLEGLDARDRARLRAVASSLAAVGLALPLADCSPTRTSGRHASEIKYGVPSSPRVIPEGQPIPKGGGRDMVGKPYVVAGRTYVPHPGKGYDREGWASWYGTAFHGRLTANGEIFDRESIAAAHPTLPLPSYVRVTNLVNKRSMVVRVNDRGPYERDRVIDLSERAAEALGFRLKGTGRVRVQYVGRASLDGSDDERLLASLRTDGAPATIAPPRTMLAQAESPRQAEQAAKMASAAAGRKDAKAAEPPAKMAALQPPKRPAEEEMRRTPRIAGTGAAAPGSAPRPVKAANLESDRRTPDVIPPRRPSLKGVN